MFNFNGYLLGRSSKVEEYFKIAKAKKSEAHFSNDTDIDPWLENEVFGYRLKGMFDELSPEQTEEDR